MVAIDWNQEPNSEMLIAAMKTNERNPTHAMDLFSALAETGSPTAMYLMGENFQRGKGVLTNQKTAEEWFVRASNKGSFLAAYALGRLYFRSQREALSIEPLRQAAAQNYAPALNFLGRIYGSGSGVEIDLDMARRYLERAAEEGHTLGRGALGALLRKYPKNMSDRFRGAWLFFAVRFEFWFVAIIEGGRSDKLQ